MITHAIHAENVSKRYRLKQKERYSTLRDTLTRTFSAPFRKFKPETSGNGTQVVNPAVAREVCEGGWIWALQNISFTVQPGEIVGIVGRNGAGKSSLLKVLARITPPTTGIVKLNGRIGSLLEIGTGFHPELTGRENIYLSGAILGMRKKEISRKFDEIVAFAEIEKFMDMPVKYYSSGMYVRLAFAVAAHMETEILLVDEVLAVGDAAFQKKCMGKMGDVAQQGRTILFVSHNMHTITELCRRCVWIDQGKIMEEGRPQAVVLSYLRSTQPESADGIIRDDMHLNPTGDFYFRKVTLLNSSGKPTSTFFHNEPFQALLEFEVFRVLEETRLIIAIERLDGIVVGIFHHTDDPGNSPLTLTPGRYQMQFETQIPLLAGGYAIHLAAKPAPGFWGNGTSWDWVPRAIAFQVEAFSKEGRGVIQAGGIVRSPARWSFSGSGSS